MTPELDLDRLLAEALRQPPDARTAFLDARCANDPELRSALDRLLRECEDRDPFLKTGGVFEGPLGEDLRALPDRLMPRMPAGHEDDELTRDTTVRGTSGANPFRVGALVANRFRILREVGNGGMGVVYAAQDAVLDRRVALKCSQPGHRDRLPPEVRAAREVSHFNVCKVYDLHLVDTPKGETEFLSMEFVEGQTLADKIRTGGPLPDAEARAIARGICAGLGQAHRQGVVHGDLKTSNILLAESPDGRVRPVITDFGLAKFAHSGGSSLMSGRGGTPDYMAPELLRGERSTIASDLYALGVLFHNMLTGRSPGRTEARPEAPPPPGAESQVATVTAASAVPAARAWPGHRPIEGLRPPWKKIVSRCLAWEPSQRFHSSDEIGDALEPRRTLLKSAVVAAAILTAGVGYWQWSIPAVGPPVRLVVLPFKMQGAAPERAAGVGLDVANRLSGLRRDFSVISPREAQQNQVDSLQAAKTVLGATHALQTTLTQAGDEVAAESSLVDVESGRTIGTVKGTYAADDMATLAKALIATVTGGFRLKSGVPPEFVNDAAYRDFVQGEELMARDGQNFDQAIPYFNRAIQLDPRSALPHAALAEALIQKFISGAGRQWLSAAGDAVQKAKSINPDSLPVLLVAGFFEQQHGRYEQAIGIFTRAAELDPNRANAWSRLGGAYERSGRTDEAEATYRKAVAAQPDGHLPLLNLANFYFRQSQFPQAEELYRRLTVLAPEVPTGHINLGLALAQQGSFQEAEQELLQAMRLRKTRNVLLNLGAIAYAQERFDEALQYFIESGASSPPAAVLSRNLGDAYRHLNRTKEARTAYEKARTMTEQEVTGNPRDAAARGRLAVLSAMLGEPGRAEYELNQALAMDPGNVTVMREGAKTYEVLQERDRTLALLQNAPTYLLEELNRQPDVKGLRKDPRFLELLKSK